MQHDLSWTVYLATKGNFLIIILFVLRRKHSGYPLSENIFVLIFSVIITESFNIHLGRITWLEAPGLPA